MSCILLFVSFILGTTGTALSLDFSTFGGVPGGPDNTQAFNSALKEACNGTDREIYFPAGTYNFYYPPDPNQCGVTLRGSGEWFTILQRQYSDGEFIQFHGNGGGLKDIAIWAARGTSGGVGLHLKASNLIGPGGNQILQNVVISGYGTYTLPLFLDGAERTVEPTGIRTVFMQNVKVFNSTWWAVEFWNAIGCEWFGGGAWQGYGTYQGIAVGGPLSTGNRIDAMIDWKSSYVWPGTLR